MALSIDSEGHDVAKWLVERGFVAIVLKYRTVQLEGQDAAQLNQSAGARFGAQLRNLDSIAEDGKYGIADGIQAVKVVRAHATEWGISSERVVFTGFIGSPLMRVRISPGVLPEVESTPMVLLVIVEFATLTTAVSSLPTPNKLFDAWQSSIVICDDALFAMSNCVPHQVNQVIDRGWVNSYSKKGHALESVSFRIVQHLTLLTRELSVGRPPIDEHPANE